MHNDVPYLAACEILVEPNGRLVGVNPNLEAFGPACFRDFLFKLDKTMHFIGLRRNGFSLAVQSVTESPIDATEITWNKQAAVWHFGELEDVEQL